MANKSIEVPGNPGTPGVHLDENDTLTINYRTPAKFCIVSGNANDFDPPLPINVAGQPSSPWTGKAIVANATITWSHVGHDKECGSNPRGIAPGTIQIGTGMK